MEIPLAESLRIAAKNKLELEKSLAKHITEAFEAGKTSVILPTCFDDGELNYHGKNKDEIHKMLKARGYVVTIRHGKVLDGGLGTKIPEALIIDWS